MDAEKLESLSNYEEGEVAREIATCQKILSKRKYIDW